MKTLTLLSLGTALIGGAYLVYAGPVINPPKPVEPTTQVKMQKMKPPTMAMCQEMMEKRTKSMQDIKSMDIAMDTLMSTVDFSTGDDRVNALAAAMRELIKQRGAMRAATTGMSTDMMSHMMMHMNSGSMTCPMMKGTSPSE